MQEIKDLYPGAHVEIGPHLDLSSLDSVRKFAEEYASSGRGLDILVNNAGANEYARQWQTPEGIGGLCAVNYLGPFLLTRLLLEQNKPKNKSHVTRVVNVSSVTHRYGRIFPDTSQFLTTWKHGSYYPNTKLANVMFAYELQRRMGKSHNVQSCAVDPGGVASNIWKGSIMETNPLLRWVITNIYAPPSDGATAVVHAATVDWNVDRKPDKALLVLHPHKDHGHSEDLRFYARGLFASPLVTRTRGVPQNRSCIPDRIRELAWGASTVVHSLLDWPIRKLTHMKVGSKTVIVPSAPLSYDKDVAASLWNASSDAVGLPHEPVA